MILEIFTYLTNGLQSAPHIALIASFIWGVLSIILSPCHLASIPLIVGFIDKQEKSSVKRAFALSSLFSLGILITIGLIGLITGFLGRILGDIGNYGNYFVAVIMVIVGLYLLGIIKFSFGNANQPNFQKKGLFAAFILGLIFGISLGPCTFAYMAPMLGVVFSVASKHLLFAISLVFFYAIGHCSVIIFAGTFTEAIQKYLNWNEESKAIQIIQKICGILVICGAIYLTQNLH
jgi:cytochrome c-type biogenesis protein